MCVHVCEIKRVVLEDFITWVMDNYTAYLDFTLFPTLTAGVDIQLGT